MSPTPHQGSAQGSTRRALLARSANGVIAGGAVVAVADLAGASPAAAAATAPATPDWINVTAVTPAADPTGTNDSTAAFNAAVEAAGSGGVVYVPAGTYKISSTVTCTAVPVYFVGDGAWASIVSYTGSGDCFRIYDPTTYGTRTKYAGGFIGITIDGASASAGATGLHVGDLLQYELDLTVQNFYGAGSKGVHLDNYYYWTEQLFGRIYAQNCTSHVVFDWTSTASTTCSGSFERCDLDIYIDQVNPAFDGVVFQNGAFVTNGSLKIRGNFGSTDTAAVSSAALRLTGSGSANGYSGSSGIFYSTIDIGVESGTDTYTPQTIAFGATGNSISSCSGALNFGAAGNTFAKSNNVENVFNFMGSTSGDPSLPGGWATYTSGFPTGVTGHVAFRMLPTGREVMVTWAFAIASGTVLKAGETIVAVNSQFAYTDNKVIPGNNSGGGLTGNVYAPAYMTAATTSEFQYAGPGYTVSGTSYWYGQGIYTLSLG